MSLTTSLTNVKITNNIMDIGRSSDGSSDEDHTYDSIMALGASATVSGNTFAGCIGGSSSSTNLITVTSGSSNFYGNRFIRGAGSPVNSYINVTSTTDQIITDNIFDQSTTDGSNDILVTGINDSSIYQRNKNQTVYIPITLADKTSTKSQWTGNSNIGFGSIMSGVSDDVDLRTNSNNFISMTIDTLSDSFYVSWNVNINTSIPFSAQLMELKVGLRGFSGGATLANDDFDNGFAIIAYVNSTLSANYATGTGSILNIGSHSSPVVTTSVSYDTIANFTAVTTTDQYIAITPTPSNYWINNGNNAIILKVYMGTRLTAGSINWIISPIVAKCRW